MNANVELVWDGHAVLGEGPVWSREESALYWVDIKSNLIHRMSWPGRSVVSWVAPESVGSVLIMPDGGFVGALKSGFYRIDLPDGGGEAVCEFLFDPEPDFPDNRFNDATVGPDGAVWAGTMDDNEGGATGALYRYFPGGECRKVDDGYVITNGPTFSNDGKRFFHTDTLKGEVYEFDVSSAGEVSNKRQFIKVDPETGHPDGMCADADGRLWGAHWGGWRVTCYSPGGEVLGYVPLPVSNVTSCVFGGDDMSTMFITSASIGLSEEELKRQPHAGGLFLCRPLAAFAPHQK